MTPRAAPSNNRADNTFGVGIEAGVVLVIFSGLGWLVDRWLGTTPVSRSGCSHSARSGCSTGSRPTYTIRIDAYERQRRERATARPDGAPR